MLNAGMVGNRRDVEDAKLLSFYTEHLTRVLLPFWQRAVDPVRGGVFTCFNNLGTSLVRREKYTWSQGRFIWIWSRIARLCQTGLLPDAAETYLAQARQTVELLWNCAVLPNGNCAFVLTEAGAPSESVTGQGYDTSFYADCFVILGFAEYATVAGESLVLERAFQLYDVVTNRVRRGNLRSDPYPIPPGLQAHSVAMILLNVTQELLEAARKIRHPRTAQLEQACESYVQQVLRVFRRPDGSIAEMVLTDPTQPSPDTVLLRHLNPGHVIEDMWFVIHASEQLRHPEWASLAVESIRQALELGWDKEYGGLLRFIDRDGAMPRGEQTGEPYEKLILDTWDTKLWWPHSEALYATLLAERMTGNPSYRRLYRQMHEYVFQTFPNPDRETGEWIQIRDRVGQPLNKLVALPVKDPYHIIRNVLLIMELLADSRRFTQGTGQ